MTLAFQDQEIEVTEDLWRVVQGEKESGEWQVQVTMGLEDYSKSLDCSKVQRDIIFVGLHGGGCVIWLYYVKNTEVPKSKAENKMSKNVKYSQGGIDTG